MDGKKLRRKRPRVLRAAQPRPRWQTQRRSGREDFLLILVSKYKLVKIVFSEAINTFPQAFPSAGQRVTGKRRRRSCNRPTPARCRSGYTWPEATIMLNIALDHILKRVVSGP